jgi:hypothetical protein
MSDPDVVVTCASTIDETARLVPESVIVVEVASPSTRLADVNDKVEFYGGIVSIRHYLVIERDRRRVVYHGRGPSGGLEPRILRVARSRSTRLASGSTWTRCIRTRNSPCPEGGKAVQAPSNGRTALPSALSGLCAGSPRS